MNSILSSYKNENQIFSACFQNDKQSEEPVRFI